MENLKVAVTDLPQVESYTSEQRAEQREHLDALNGAIRILRRTTSVKTQRAMERIIARESVWFETQGVPLKTLNDQTSEEIVSYTLRLTREEQTEDTRWELAFMVADADHEVEQDRKALLRMMESLRDELNRSIETVRDPESDINALGIIQGRGLTIDRECTLYMEAKKRRRAINRIAKLAGLGDSLPATPQAA